MSGKSEIGFYVKRSLPGLFSFKSKLEDPLAIDGEFAAKVVFIDIVFRVQLQGVYHRAKGDVDVVGLSREF